MPLSTAALEDDVYSRQLVVGGSCFAVHWGVSNNYTVTLWEMEIGGEMRCPAREAGVLDGDVIMLADGMDPGADAAWEKMEQGQSVDLLLLRGEKMISLTVTPLYYATEERYVVGLDLDPWVEDCEIISVCTLSFYDPASGLFAMTGHSTDAVAVGMNYNNLISQAYVYGVEDNALDTATYYGSQPGLVFKNSKSGTYGKFYSDYELAEGPTFTVAPLSQVELGEAYILSNRQGDEPEKYMCEVVKIKENSIYSLVIRLADPRISDIAHGMSGSPVLQNGRIIGVLSGSYIEGELHLCMSAETMLNELLQLERQLEEAAQ